mmetsp:Transcript_9882/g.10863  ORF Transcript_9882/g.10863 Transcript_9882/m.10863 type:complete len:102 (-) Transcript_9882:232-537(-)
MSDWSAVEPLSEIQIHYAADDAFFPLLLVAQLGGLADAGVDFEHLKENVKAVDNKDRYDAMVKKPIVTLAFFGSARISRTHCGKMWQVFVRMRSAKSSVAS